MGTGQHDGETGCHPGERVRPDVVAEQSVTQTPTYERLQTSESLKEPCSRNTGRTGAASSAAVNLTIRGANGIQCHARASRSRNPDQYTPWEGILDAVLEADLDSVLKIRSQDPAGPPTAMAIARSMAMSIAIAAPGRTPQTKILVGKKYQAG